MNKLLLIAAFMITGGFAFCQDAHFQINKSKSKIYWKATYLIRGGHEGFLELASGSILTADNILKKGDFIVDMNSMKTTDLKGKSADDLIDHLKSDDFFSVAKFPQAYFNIVNVIVGKSQDVTTIVGSLRIKDVGKTITFPAIIIVKGNIASAKATFTINRTRWDITYQSQSIFNDLKDGVISDEITITLDLTFDKVSE
jgi:polyisoprenoid-binding protein YceI